MNTHTAIISDGKTEWEEDYIVPDILDPEDTIKTTIRMFNRSRKIKYSFIKLKIEQPKRKRRNGR